MKNSSSLIINIILVVSMIVCVQQSLQKKEKMQELSNDFEICADLFDSKQYEDTKKCIKDYIKESPNDYDAHYMYAISLLETKEYTKAKKEFKFYLDNKNKVKDEDRLKIATRIYENLNNQNIVDKETYQRMDYGNYYTDLEDQSAIWKNPENITVYIENSLHYQTIKKAFELWDDSLYNLINFTYVNNPQDANISCIFVDSIDKENALGITYSETYYEQKCLVKANGEKVRCQNVSHQPYFKSAKIELLKKYLNSDREMSEKEYYAITLHEIGHALGIQSHSNQRGDIMYKDTSGYMIEEAKLSNRDINTVKRIYGNF